MKILHIPLLDCSTEYEFRNAFITNILGQDLNFEGFPVKLFPEDFDHICFEPAKDGLHKGKFSLRRARKLLILVSLCNKEIPYTLIHQVDRDNKSVCVLSEQTEFAIFLIPKTSQEGNYFRLGTILSYGKNVESKILKQKNAGIILSSVSEVFL